jgi:outer membrane protein TolC
MRSKRLTAEARRAAERESVTAWQGLRTAIAQALSFGEQVRANELALEGVRREQEVGARTILDILDAEQELLDSRVSLVASQTDEVVARHRLLAAVGALTAVNLGLDAEYYDPAKHYRAVRNKIIGTGPSVD